MIIRPKPKHPEVGNICVPRNSGQYNVLCLDIALQAYMHPSDKLEVAVKAYPISSRERAMAAALWSKQAGVRGFSITSAGAQISVGESLSGTLFKDVQQVYDRLVREVKDKDGLRRAIRAKLQARASHRQICEAYGVTPQFLQRALFGATCDHVEDLLRGRGVLNGGTS